MAVTFHTPISMPSSAGTGTVRSIERAMVLLEALAVRDGTRLTELSRHVGLSLSTAHRLMTTLQQLGFVQCDPVTNRWHVGLRAHVVGAAFSRPDNFVAGVMPFLRGLRDQTGETVSLGMADSDGMLFAGRVEGKGVVRAIGKVGSHVPLTVSGMGKALLAASPAKAIRPVFVAATPKSIRTRADLEANLQLVRDRGFAVDDEECQSGVRCVAALVYDQHAEPRYAVSISAGIDRLTDDRIARAGTLVRQVALEMTTSIGGQLPA